MCYTDFFYVDSDPLFSCQLLDFVILVKNYNITGLDFYGSYYNDNLHPFRHRKGITICFELILDFLLNEHIFCWSNSLLNASRSSKYKDIIGICRDKIQNLL